MRRAAPDLRAGALWSAANAAASVLLPLGIFVAFVRLLRPEALGAVALAVAVSELLKALGWPGLYEAMLSRRQQRARHLRAGLAVLLLLGPLLFALHLLLVRWLLPAEAPESLRLAAMLIGLRIPLDLAALQPQAVLAQRLNFRLLSLRGIVANLGAGAAGLGVAAAGLPLAGMVVYLVGLSVLVFATTVAGTRSLLRPRLDRSALRALSAQGSMASAVRFLGVSNNQLDQLVLGALVGPRPLGLFNVAKRLEGTFVTLGAAFAGNLFQPVFAAGDPRRSAAVAGKGLLLLTLGCGGGAAWFVANHRDAVVLAFGADWAEAAPLAAWLALGGLARALGGVPGAWLSVSGRNGRLLLLAAASAVAGTLIAALVAPRDVALASALLAGRSAVVAAATVAAAMADARASLRALLGAVLLPLAALLLAAGAGRWAGLWLFGTEGLPAALAVMAASGAAVLLVAAPLALPLLRRGGLRG